MKYREYICAIKPNKRKMKINYQTSSVYNAIPTSTSFLYHLKNVIKQTQIALNMTPSKLLTK